jgi:hypothetical protein
MQQMTIQGDRKQERATEYAENTENDGRWLAGDFHNHTWLTDGSNVPEQVFAHAFQYGLDWIANSEHGGAFGRNAAGTLWPPKTVFLGSPPDGMMWRWQSLWQYSHPRIVRARTTWPDKLIVQGYEWNVPSHDHASVAIVGPAEENGLAVARHEYLFDDKDSGTTADRYLGISGKLVENNHDKAVAGVRWLDQHYPENSYFVINHPSRWQNYSIAAIRDLNDAAPNVAFGFEGMPGHQKAPSRGDYDGGPFQDGSGHDITFRARTFGGADYMLAKVGGIWDALLGEGRMFFIFVNSDFHTTGHDFWPGEYAKNYTFVRDQDHDGNYSPEELVAGLRSGNSFIVQGDLINGLRFSVGCRQKGTAAEMGGTLEVNDACDPQLIIRFQSPQRNNNGDTVAVDHIDLIAGEVKGKVSKVLADGITANPEFASEVNKSARVLASFTRKDWREEASGQDAGGVQPEASDSSRMPPAGSWKTIRYQLPHLDRDMYFRLRGTSLGCAVPNETDEQGNPLSDELLAPNSADKAYADLWFYSNPVFVQVRNLPGSGPGLR